MRAGLQFAFLSLRRQRSWSYDVGSLRNSKKALGMTTMIEGAYLLVRSVQLIPALPELLLQ